MVDEVPKKLNTKIFGQDENLNVNTIVIGGWSSKCGNCHQNAFPDEGSHKTVKHDNKEIFLDDKSGMGRDRIIPAEPGIEGCGTEWKYMYCEYTGQKDNCLSKWPQYEWIGDD